MGDNLLITRDGNTSITYTIDYNLQTYVPIPKAGERPVSVVNNRGDLDIVVVWKDSAGVEVPLPFDKFLPNTVYKAEIKLSPKAKYGFDPSASFEYHPGKITAQNDDRGEPVRTVIVTYNNSDDADITFIIDYNLQSYVPIPLAGEKPVRSVMSRGDVTVEAAWKVETSEVFVSIPAGDSYTFAKGAVYRADIWLTANSGYRFSTAKNFDYPAGTVDIPPGPDSGSDRRELSSVTYLPVKDPVVITEFNLTPYIPRPINRAGAVTSFGGAQYTGTVSWKESGSQAVLVGPFQAGVEYTAEVTLTPAIGYGFTGVGQNRFTHTGAQRVTNPANSGTVRLEFSATGSPSMVAVFDTILTSRIPKPAYGVTPITSFAGNQYTGTVVWKNTDTNAPLVGSFQSNIPYTAVAALNAVPGYTFIGIGENAFTHGDALRATNLPGSGTVTIKFPPEDFLNYTANTFGPVGAAGSALKLMMEKSTDNRAVTIELSPGAGPEVLVPNSIVLTADLTSPANVTIDGHGRELKPEGLGTLLTVGAGVTLTLRNITLIGIDDNTSPLVEVRPRGRLILGEGATLTENQTYREIGGVLVNGGELVMNDGAIIKKMVLLSGEGGTPDLSGIHAGSCGVLVCNRGKFTMNGGFIGGEEPGDGNIYHYRNAFFGEVGGGVVIYNGSFDMYGGTIQYNRGGGGMVVSDNGLFTMYGGTIKENKAGEDPYELPRGVLVVSDGTFIMNGGTIEDDVYLMPPYASFTKNGGTISNMP
jgi:hypothetical protein